MPLGVDVVSNAKWDGSKLVVTTHAQQSDQVTSYLKTYYAKGR
jgi:hypothetical protein